MLFGASCSGSEADQVATGPDGRPLVTTAPLTVPPRPDPSATTGPVDTPSPTAADAPWSSADPTAPPTLLPTAPPDPTPAVSTDPSPGESPAAGATSPPVATAPAATPDPNSPAADETSTADTPTTEATTRDPVEPLVGADGVIGLGDFDVVNLVTGATQNIAELAPSGPTMLWFWTPSCETCQFEAPSIVQFARDNPSIAVVGVGAGIAANGDSVDAATAFVDRFGAADAGMTMLYDVSFRAWRRFGVRNQPWVVLFDRDGRLIFTQQGRVDLTGAAEAMGV